MPGLKWRSRLAQLVAGGQHGHPRAAGAFDLGEPNRGDHPRRGGVDLGSGGDHGLPRLDVLPGAADVGADLRDDARPSPPHHRRRCPRPGPRHRRRPGPSRRSRSRTPRPAAARDPRDGRRATRRRPGASIGVAAEIGGAYGVAVHRRVVEARDRVGARDVGGQDPAESRRKPRTVRLPAAPRRARERARGHGRSR